MGVITKWLPVRDRRGRTVMGSSRTDIIVPNLSWSLLPYELDMAIIQKNHYLTEIEIKRSFSDLKADFKKGHHHDAKKVYKFYYCIPLSIKDKAINAIKEYYSSFGDYIPAILTYDEDGSINMASKFGDEYRWGKTRGEKLTDDEIVTCCRMLSIRYWKRLIGENEAYKRGQINALSPNIKPLIWDTDHVTNEEHDDDIKIAYIGKYVLGYYRIVRREVERGRRKRYIETKFELTYSGDKAFYQEYDDLDTAKKEADKDILRRISECLGIGKIEKPVGYSGCAFDGHGYTDEQMKR